MRVTSRSVPALEQALPQALLMTILCFLSPWKLGRAVRTCRSFHEIAAAVAISCASDRRLTITPPAQGEGWISALLTAEVRAGAQRLHSIASGIAHTLWLVHGILHSSGGDPQGVSDLSLLGYADNAQPSTMAVEQNGVPLDGSLHDVLMQPVRALASVCIVEIAAGLTHSLALSADSRVYSFGRNAYGQLGEPPGKYPYAHVELKRREKRRHCRSSEIS